MRFLGPFVGLLLTASFSRAADRHEVEAVPDLAYGTGEKQKLDLYLPKGLKDFPVLVFVHGGGYQRGDRKDGAAAGKAFAARGVGTAVISYRLFPRAKHPAQIQDVAKAFAWVKREAAARGGNRSRVFVGGHPAGARLAALLATDKSSLESEKLGLRDVAGAVAISGGHRILPVRKDVFGSQAAMDRASPFAHRAGGHPPFLIVYGDGDTVERHALSKEFRDAPKKAGGEAEVLEVTDRTHQELSSKLGDGEGTTEATPAFIGRVKGRSK